MVLLVRRILEASLVLQRRREIKRKRRKNKRKSIRRRQQSILFCQRWRRIFL
jgi:hypothetical protein